MLFIRVLTVQFQLTLYKYASHIFLVYYYIMILIIKITYVHLSTTNATASTYSIANNTKAASVNNSVNSVLHGITTSNMTNKSSKYII